MQERIKDLFQKYLNNTSTREEFEEVLSAMADKDNDVYLEQCLDEQLKQGATVRSMKTSRRRKALSIAAAILITVAAGTGWYLLGNKRAVIAAAPPAMGRTTVTKITQRSEYRYLLLPDSTQVWLNAASTLEFPDHFTGKTREVYLKGEAYFDVKHADKVPFIIYTGEVSTMVLGTAFNIKAYPDLEKITVSVKRGKVRVNFENKEVAILTRGEEVVIGSRDKKVKERAIKSEADITWHEGNLVYDDYSIEDILSDLQRVYDVKINVANPEIRQLHVSTSFRRAQGAEIALDILCRLTDTHLILENGTYNLITTPKTKN